MALGKTRSHLLLPQASGVGKKITLHSVLISSVKEALVELSGGVKD